MRGLRTVVVVAAALVASCHAPVDWQGRGSASWPRLADRFAQERIAHRPGRWAAAVRVRFHRPHGGGIVGGRGAMAVAAEGPWSAQEGQAVGPAPAPGTERASQPARAPLRAARMILVGGAGSTLLDVWVTPDRWRVAVPPIHLVRRGGVDDPDDLPVGFLRWWLFTPLRGELLAGADTAQGVAWMVRDRDAQIELRLGRCDRGSLRTVTRLAGGRTEQVEECREGVTMRPGDWVRYRDLRSGLGVDLLVESIANAPPEDDAFRDPNAVGMNPSP